MLTITSLNFLHSNFLSVPWLAPEPLPFRHDDGCVGPRDKGSIPRGAYYKKYADDIVLCDTRSDV